MVAINVLVRLPGSTTAESVCINSDQTAQEAVTTIVYKLEVVNLQHTKLVISPSKKKPGAIISPITTFRNLTFNPKEDILELWHAPHMIPVAVYLRENLQDNIRERKPLPVDFGIRLIHMIPTLQRALDLPPDQDFVLQYAPLEGENPGSWRWLSSQMSLADQGVEPNNGILLCYPTAKLLKTAETSLLPEARGWLWKRSMKKDRTTNKQRRLFVLADSFLYYYKKERDSSPAGVIPLDYYLITDKLSLKKLGRKSIILTASFDSFKLTDNFKLQAESLDAHDDWFEKIRRKCMNSGNQRVFGVPLRDVLARQKDSKFLPNIVRDCISYIDENALEQEGIFRLSATASTVEYYKDQYDLGEKVQLSHISDHNLPAALMKLYFRQLPEPLFTFALYQKLTSIASLADSAAQAGQLPEVLAELPLDHYATAKALFSFLARVAAKEDINKMNAANLATVFGPNLIRPDSDSAVEHLSSANSLTELLILQHDEIFRRAEELNPALRECSGGPKPSGGWATGLKNSGPRAPQKQLLSKETTAPILPARGITADGMLFSKPAPPSKVARPAGDARTSPQGSPASSPGSSPQVARGAPVGVPARPARRPSDSGSNPPAANNPQPQLNRNMSTPISRPQMKRVSGSPLAGSSPGVSNCTLEELAELIRAEIALRESLEAQVQDLLARIQSLEDAK